jgi:hypothetical protein
MKCSGYDVASLLNGLRGAVQVVSSFITVVITNSVVLVSERAIPTERPPLVGEVSANFCGWRGAA